MQRSEVDVGLANERERVEVDDPPEKEEKRPSCIFGGGLDL